MIEIRYLVTDISSDTRVARAAEYSAYIFPKLAVPLYGTVASSFYVSTCSS